MCVAPDGVEKTMDALLGLRQAFPALDAGLGFFDWASTGLVPEPSLAAVHAYLRAAGACAATDATWVHGHGAKVRSEIRRTLARWLRGNPRDIALVENTTQGLNLAAQSTRLAPGDNVILSELDYLAVHMPWRQRARKDKLELRIVPHSDGRLRAEDLLERMDERTRVIAVSTIGWTTGELVNVDLLAREARQRGILLVLDATQTFGLTGLQVHEHAPHFVACGGHKWLLGSSGLGFLWVHPETAARQQPHLAGFLAGHPPQGSWPDWFASPQSRVDDEVLIPAVGQSFESGGTANIAGSVLLHGNLQLLDAVGPEQLLAHARSLGQQLIAGLDAKGYAVRSPRDDKARAGMVVFNAESAEAEQRLVAALRGQRIALSVRYTAGVGGVRASLHGANTANDVARLLDALPTR